MALRAAAAAPLVVLLLLAAACGSVGSAGDDAGWSFSFDTMVGCATPPGPAEEASEAGGAAASFRARLAPLLAALPAAAAATGFASLPSASAGAGAGRGRARALGLCFGPAAPAESGCGECLEAAVAAVGACAGDVRGAGAWRPGCAVVYADEDRASSLPDEDGDSQPQPRSPAGDARPYPDGLELEQRLADLAEALAKHNRRPLWKMALSVLFYVLAAIGAVSVVLLLCVFLAACCLAASLFRNVDAAGQQRGNAGGGAEQGEGIAVYVAATNGPAPVWSLAMQLRFH
ncbi:unnamed protein product [Urochloa humidicola]